MDDVFNFRNRLIGEYSSFSRSFSKVAAPDILIKVEEEYTRGRYWPEPLIQINPNYKRSGTVQQLANEGVLHADCAHIFQTGKAEGKSADLHLYVHQLRARAKARKRQGFIVTTGSGKSLSFFIPIIDCIVTAKVADPQKRTRAIAIYPMNALANSHLEDMDKFCMTTPAKPFACSRTVNCASLASTARKGWCLRLGTSCSAGHSNEIS